MDKTGCFRFLQSSGGQCQTVKLILYTIRRGGRLYFQKLYFLPYGTGNFLLETELGTLWGGGLTPDWDILGANNAEGRMINELPIIGHFLFGISSTYGSIFRRHHRSFITHFPFVSTFVRLLFILLFPFILGDYLGINFIGNGWHKFWIGFWVGLSQADGIHFWLDRTQGER